MTFLILSLNLYFAVLPHVSSTIEFAENNLLPQWAIAVIVIGLASLLFAVILGITIVSTAFVLSYRDYRNIVSF